ncbi:MAG TPA: arginine deiminase family protein [Vicinamibacteria bacterium]|nr:arginine deiminase family protein [Vicinamibacteria bacterium]
MISGKKYGGHTMTGVLRRVLICSPKAAGWADPKRTSRWRELSYYREPDFTTAEAQHAELRRELEAFGTEVLSLPATEDLSLDGIYVHDASLITDGGAILMHPGKPARRGEPVVHAGFYEAQGIPILGAIRSPGTAEAGDMVWLDSTTLLVGHGYRTNDSGIDQIRSLLEPQGVDVLVAPLPHGPGPSVCLHLMSLISLVDERTALVDLPWLAVQTVQQLRRQDFKLIEIYPSERETMACNVLALGDRKLLALEENDKTNLRLRQEGFEVQTFYGTEISQNGGGGPTCLTRPVLRG